MCMCMYVYVYKRRQNSINYPPNLMEVWRFGLEVEGIRTRFKGSFAGTTSRVPLRLLQFRVLIVELLCLGFRDPALQV